MDPAKAKELDEEYYEHWISDLKKVKAMDFFFYGKTKKPLPIVR